MRLPRVAHECTCACWESKASAIKTVIVGVGKNADIAGHSSGFLLPCDLVISKTGPSLQASFNHAARNGAGATSS
jgi:hypothetical protein